jgi:hypothetical protein
VARVRSAWASPARRLAPADRRYLAPELQLLYKSKDVRPKDQVDAEEVIPSLSDERAARLRGALAPDHAWQVLLGER